MENQDIKEVTQEVTQKEEKKENFIIAYIKTYAKENPKNTIKIMIGLVILSLLLTFTTYIYNNYYRETKSSIYSTTQILNGASQSLSSPIKATQNVLEIKKIMDELEFYKVKENLTKEDSIRIKYLIDKSKALQNEK